MPNVMVPVVKWPSTAETARHVTVYTPLPTALGKLTRSDAGSPATGWIGPVGTFPPAESRTCADDSPGSGRSLNLSVIAEGA
jgi:hypothetical protein